MFSNAYLFGIDAENHLVTAAKTGLSAAYAYDTNGRRVHKSGTGTTAAFYLYDGDTEIEEFDSSGALSKRFIPGPAIDDNIAMVQAAGDMRYPHVNHQGSMVGISNGNGNLNNGPYVYDPHGNINDTTGGYPFRFTGQYLDAETGLYYYRARMYDPKTGRFYQTDQVGYTSDLNLYTYVGNDPINASDASGECAPEVCKYGDYGDIEAVNETYSDTSVGSLHPNIGSLATSTSVDGTTERQTSSHSENIQVAQVDAPGHRSGGGGGGWGPEPGLGNGGEDIIFGIMTLPMGGEGFEEDVIESTAERSIDRLSRAAELPDRNGLTKAGRALQKHGGRPGSAFSQISGHANLNQAGQHVVDDILTTPGTVSTTNRFGGMDIVAPDGRGVRYDAQGNLMGFLEPKR